MLVFSGGFLDILNAGIHPVVGRKGPRGIYGAFASYRADGLARLAALPSIGLRREALQLTRRMCVPEDETLPYLVAKATAIRWRPRMNIDIGQCSPPVLLEPRFGDKGIFTTYDPKTQAPSELAKHFDAIEFGRRLQYLGITDRNDPAVVPRIRKAMEGALSLC